MEYYLQLARDQRARYQDFRIAHPQMEEMECRMAFFGQRREVNISHSITKGISEVLEYQGKLQKESETLAAFKGQ